MDLGQYQHLLTRARQLSRRPDEAADLVQDTLLAALEAGRSDAAWLEGVMRRQAALASRTAVRRRTREALAADVPAAMPPAPAAVPDARPLLRRLPPSARRLAVLALHGLDAAEIQWILGIAPTAFRQRLSRIRRALGELPAPLADEARALAGLRDPARALPLQFGLVRRALKAALAGRDGLGTHDADGHLIVLRGAHTPARRGNE